MLFRFCPKVLVVFVFWAITVIFLINFLLFKPVQVVLIKSRHFLVFHFLNIRVNWVIAQISPFFSRFATSLAIAFRVNFFVYIFHGWIHFVAFFSSKVLHIYRSTPKLSCKLSGSQFSRFGHIWVNNFDFGRNNTHSTFWIWIGASSCNWFWFKRAISWYPNLCLILIKSFLGLLSQFDHGGSTLLLYRLLLL